MSRFTSVAVAIVKSFQYKMFEDLPLFRNTVKILKFWSIILDCNWKRYFCLISCTTLNVGQFFDAFTTSKPFDVIARDAYILVLWHCALLRTIMIIINRFRYEEFMEQIKDTYEEIQKNESDEAKELLVKTTNSARSMGIVNIILVTSVSIGFIIYPLFASSRVLPYGMYVPIVDKYQSPWYEIVYIFQFIVTPPGNGMYTPFTNLIVAFIMFGQLRCKVLQCHLRNLNKLNRKDVYNEVVWCIRYQMDIMRYVKTINSLTSYIFLVEFLASGALLCALMVLLNIVDSKAQSIIACCYFIMLLSQLLSVYWYANELSDESTKIAVAAYDSNWFDFDVKTGKAILLLIARAQKPCEIMVGNMYPMTLPMFQSLLNASYSYFTLLRRVYN